MHNTRTLLNRTRRPERLRRPAVAAALATVALVTVILALAGCAQHPASAGASTTAATFSGEPDRAFIGILGGDPHTGCVWLGDPTGSPVELILPAGVTVTFSPSVTLRSTGRTLHAGQMVAAHLISAATGRPGCPLPDRHQVSTVEPPTPAGPITRLPPPTTPRR